MQQNRIRAIIGNLKSKNKYYSNSNNEYNNRPFTYLDEKTLKKYTFKKIPTKKLQFTDKYNKHGIAYMETNKNGQPYLLPLKKKIKILKNLDLEMNKI